MMPLDFYRQASIERIRGHIQSLEGVRHPEAAPAALEQAADYIAARLADQKCDVAEQVFYENERPFRNIIGTLAGRGNADERVMVIAHYDTVAVTPGADDNASGVAVMLEAAALLASLEFDRTIHFIGVALEENAIPGNHGTGTRGSSALARHARQNGWSLAGVVVLESVAYAGVDCVQSKPAGFPEDLPTTGDFLAVVGNQGSKDLVHLLTDLMADKACQLPHLPLLVPGNGEMLPDSRRSDHAPFWDAGYPAVMLTDTANFRNPHYHQPSDTLDTLNLEFALKVCCAACACLATLAGEARD